MRFAHPEFLWLLAALPLLAGYLFLFRAGDLPGFRFSAGKRVFPAAGSPARHKGLWILHILRITALGLLILGLARPQKGLRSAELTAKAADIIFCLDASHSMLAIDFKPDNRFEVAKQVMKDFVKGRTYDRMGLVLFAENAVTLCPLTLDRSALLHVLDVTDIGAIPPNRTAIGEGIATSVNRLRNSEAKSKVIILLTDGANNAGVIDPLTAGKAAAALDIKIYAVGAASPGTSLIPVDDPVVGRRMAQIADDIDEDMLLRVAEGTGGTYYRARNEAGLKTIFAEIDALERTDINIQEYVDYDERFLWLLVIAAALLLLELALAKTAFRFLP